MARQSQAIAPEFLSVAPDVPGNARLLDHKADYTFSFSHEQLPGLVEMHQGLKATGNTVISHLTDAFAKKCALYSCVEVKPADGDETEAEYQLSIWMAASLRKKQQLARQAGFENGQALVEPCFVVVGHHLHLYIAYVESLEQNSIVHVLGPEPLDGMNTGTASGVFRQLRVWRNLIAYGKDESTEGFWGGFMSPLLDRLAGKEP
jgi:hypothetical protein